MSDDIPVLLRTLQNESVMVQMAAANALKRVGAPAVPGIIEVLGGDNQTARATAARLLGEIPMQEIGLAIEAVDALRAALDDSYTVTRWYAAGSIGAIAEAHPQAGERATDDLIPLLEDDSIPTPSAKQAVCEVAASSLRSIGTDAALEAVRAWWGTDDDEDWGLDKW